MDWVTYLHLDTYIIAMSEASSNLARFDGVRYGPARAASSSGEIQNYRDQIERYRNQFFGAEVKRRILIGSHTLSAGYYDQYYVKALRVRNLISNAFLRAFKNYDVLLGPTMPDIAFKFHEKSADPLAMYLIDIFTVPVNLAGIPALSVPCGFHQGLPIGMQLIGPRFSDYLLLDLGKQYQEITPHHTDLPPIK